MAEPGFIQALIADYQHILQFNWLVQAPLQALPERSLPYYWIGEYAPDRYHPVEIIHRDNLGQLMSTLQQGRLYETAQAARLKPVLLIFSDQCSDTAAINRLQQDAIAVLQSPLPARIILRELAYGLAEHCPRQTVHGVMLSIAGHGVLLNGRSGIGKSALALELVSRGHALVVDDAPVLHRPPGSEQLIAVCPPLLAELLEVRALGILDIVKLFGQSASRPLCQLDLVIELVEEVALDAMQRLQVFDRRTDILGVDVTQIQIPIRYPASLATIVETATRNHVLYQQGHDASDTLIKRQQDTLSRQTV